MSGTSPGCRYEPSLVGLVGLVAGAVIPVATVTADPPPASAPDRLAAAGARLAWRVPLALPFTASIRSYHLVDEYLYAIGSDGVVRSIRADTGQHLWTRQLVDAGETLWPPTAYHSAELGAVVFTRLLNVLLLDPATGSDRENRDQNGRAGSRERKIVRGLRLKDPTSASVAVSAEKLFAVSIGRRLQSYDITTGDPSWRAATPATVRLAPLYLSDGDQLLVADEGGLIVGIDATTKARQFARQLHGEPTGWLAADAKAVYVATSEPRLYALDRAKGETLLEHHLPGRPLGGPAVTAKSVYQALVGGGLQRVSLDPQSKGWLAPHGKRFLAEWPDRAVLLSTDGRIVFVEPNTGKSLAVLDLGDVADGVSNVFTDAVMVASSRGEVRCIRPIGARALTGADFRPPPTQAPKSVEQGPTAEEAGGAGQTAGAAGEPAEQAAPRMTLEERILADPLRSRATSEP